MENWRQKALEWIPFFKKSGLIMIIMFYPIGLIHESGHALICVSNSGSFEWSDFFLHQVFCNGNIDSYFLYWSLGGIFGMIASSLVLILRRIRKNKAFMLGVLTVMFTQFVNFVFETFAHFAYLNSPIASMLMSTSTIIFFFSLLNRFASTPKNET